MRGFAGASHVYGFYWRFLQASATGPFVGSYESAARGREAAPR